MKPSRSAIRLFAESCVVLVCALLGLSLTRTKASEPENGFAFAAAGAVIAVVALLVSRALSPRVATSLPPLTSKQVLALKLLVGGFCVAVLGWLLAVFVQLNAGVAVAALGIGIAFVGMAMHFYLMLTRNDG
jgi:drug/metabolite transporter (DMT)-like permease